MNNETKSRKKFLLAGSVLILVAAILTVAYSTTPAFNPKLTVREYLDHLKKADLEKLKQTGPAEFVEKKVREFGENYLDYIKNIHSIYYKTGFEKWARLYEKIWYYGAPFYPRGDMEDRHERIAEKGFSMLSPGDKKEAVNYGYFILEDHELLDERISRRYLFKGYMKYYMENSTPYQEMLDKFSKDKLDYILQNAGNDAAGKYKKIVETFDLKKIDPPAFIKLHGERILKEKLEDKYKNTEVHDMTCVYTASEFYRKPLNGDEAFVLVKLKGNAGELIFRVKRDNFNWEVTDIPGKEF